jgi:hypothetical protein
MQGLGSVLNSCITVFLNVCVVHMYVILFVRWWGLRAALYNPLGLVEYEQHVRVVLKRFFIRFSFFVLFSGLPAGHCFLFILDKS